MNLDHTSNMGPLIISTLFCFMFPETIEFFRSIRHDECLFFDGKYTLEFVFFRSRQIQHLLNAE